MDYRNRKKHFVHFVKFNKYSLSDHLTFQSRCLKINFLSKKSTLCLKINIFDVFRQYGEKVTRQQQQHTPVSLLVLVFDDGEIEEAYVLRDFFFFSFPIGMCAEPCSDAGTARQEFPLGVWGYHDGEELVDLVGWVSRSLPMRPRVARRLMCLYNVTRHVPAGIVERIRAKFAGVELELGWMPTLTVLIELAFEGEQKPTAVTPVAAAVVVVACATIGCGVVIVVVVVAVVAIELVHVFLVGVAVSTVSPFAFTAATSTVVVGVLIAVVVVIILVFVAACVTRYGRVVVVANSLLCSVLFLIIDADSSD